MQLQRSLVAIALVGMLAAACGASTPTQAPPATQGPGGGATADPGGGGPTTNPGGGGPGDTQFGKVHIEIRGPIEHTGDYAFVPAGSLFGGTQGSSLNFTNASTSEIVSILISADGSVLVSFGSESMTVPAAECTTSNWNIGATSASGSFDCTAGLAITASGATVQGVTVKGNFDART